MIEKRDFYGKGCICDDKSSLRAVVTVPDTVTLRFNTPDQERKTEVTIDMCLICEIKWLWQQGIVTWGCCCGHRKLPLLPSIIVDEHHFEQMKTLGYRQYPHRSDMFFPLTLESDEMGERDE